MNAFRKPIFMLASHVTEHIPGNLLSDHCYRSSHIAEPEPGILKKNHIFISKLLRIRDILLGKLLRYRTTFYTEVQRASSSQTTSMILSPFSGQEINTELGFRPDTEWVPLIKANIASKPNSDQELTKVLNQNHNLAGQTVLCVGGRAALYADYFRLVTAAGGYFMIYRGNTENSGDHFNNLLDRANMLICPVDCVSHDDYFAVKRYCKLTGKSCAFLERSSLPAFTRGLVMLISQLHGDPVF